MAQDKKSEADERQASTERKFAELEKKATEYQEQVGRTQNELDRLLDILKEMEDEKFQKDKQIKDLQEYEIYHISFHFMSMSCIFFYDI